MSQQMKNQIISIFEMELNKNAKKVCLFLDSDSDSEGQKEVSRDESKQETIRYEKIYAIIPQKVSKQKNHQKRDKFEVNRLGKGMFSNQTDARQFDSYEVMQNTKKIQASTKSKPNKQKIIKNQKSRPISLQYLATSNQLSALSSSKQNTKQTINTLEIDEKSEQSPKLIKLHSQTLLPNNNKMFKLNLSESSLSQQQSQQDQTSKEQHKNEKNRGKNQGKIKKQNKKLDKKDQTSQSQQSDQQKKSKKSNDQQSDDEDQEGSSKQAQIQPFFKDFVFNNQIQFSLLEEVKPDERLRAVIERSRSGFNMLWPEYSIRVENSQKQFLYVKKSSFSLRTCYQIILKGKNGQERYFGKLQSNAEGVGYTIHVSEDGTKQSLRAQIIFPIQTGNRQPRYFTMLIIADGYRLEDLKWQSWKHKQNLKTLQSLYKCEENKNKIRYFQTKKPVYNTQLRGFVLNFGGRVNVPSIKNFILEQVQTGKQVLMFGKINKDSFRLQISSPLNCVIGTALSLIQFQAGLSD